MQGNIDTKVVEGFADEWTRFDQSKLEGQELEQLFNQYFECFPWEKLPKDAIAFDRFGTRLEKRFTKIQIREMMERCGLENIRFAKFPFWTAVGTKR